jgi:quercetin dioxygenase-like cupin family protein
MAQAVQAAQLVDYQDGAIVSKSVLKKKTGSMTLFAFDRGEGLSEHTVPYDAVVHVLEGQAAVSLGGTQQTLGPGDLMILDAGIPHAVKAESRFKMMLTLIKETAQEQGGAPSSPGNPA